MIEQATLNHAARVLAATAEPLPADIALRQYFVAHPYLGGRERRAISRALFTYFRWYKWLDEGASPQKRVEQAVALHDKFTADPKSIKPEALAARAVPAWLREEMDVPVGFLLELQREPALWLRARPGTAGRLGAQLRDCVPTPRAPDALHYRGQQDLFRTAQFHEGAFEIQDLASQLVGVAAAPNPGETWWDTCAGEGGKMLHLADLMANKGLIWATDRSVRRIENLKRRAARAKIFNFRTAAWDGSAKLPTKTKFDGILIDAPCSGVGTWQRNPHARWSTSLDDVRELAVIQRALLEHVAGSLKPGGRLIYSVCTLTRTETSGVVDAFTAAHPELAPAPLSSLATDRPSLLLWPHELHANGMFVASWRKAK